MHDQAFPCLPLTDNLRDRLTARIGQERQLMGPVPDGTGNWRIAPLTGGAPDFAVVPRIPLKKELIPHRETVWNFRDGQYQPPDHAPMRAILGVALCDLQALWYLDRVFAEDARYQQRRQNLLVVGAVCEAGPECRCDAARMPVGGDLYVGRDKVWALSPRGLAVLASLTEKISNEAPLPWPESPSPYQSVPEKKFLEQKGASIWIDEGERCLSCGACSAVCPTCYCFDLVDVASLGGTVSRQRAWDNCFFAEHGRVAGGFDFRPDRAARLRFRFEHKRLGFGDLRGQDSCVGCGRCRQACPVDIDLEHIAAQLAAEVPDAG